MPEGDRLCHCDLHPLNIIGDPGRAYLPKDRFAALATYEVAVTRALEDSEVKKVTVWQFP
jgi:predicted nicotinamide N-methyase